MSEERRKSVVREGEKDLMKEAIKEGLREWLDEKYAAFGRWTFRGLMALTFSALVWLIALSQGWHKV